MAHLFPTLPPSHALSPSEFAEISMVRELAVGLSDAYSVFHNIEWVQSADGQMRHGELDAVVVNQAGDVLILELKTGSVIFRPEGIFKDYDGEVKNVLAQVKRQHGSICARLAEAKLHATVHHLLVLPDVRVQDGSVQWPRDRIVDATDMAHLITRVSTVLAPGIATDRHSRVIRFFQNRFRVEPDVSVLSGQLAQATTRMAAGLATWVPRLHVPSGIIRVSGTAGSGKTQLALRILRDAAAAGKRTAYLCFNRALADHFARIAPAQTLTETFHEFAVRFARQQGLTIDPAKEGAFQTAIEYLLANLANVASNVDCLVIDEMQDFQPDWVQAVLARLSSSGRAVLLEDQSQCLYKDREPFDIDGAVTITSNENYRSPRSLVDLINRLGLADAEIEAMSPYVGETAEPIVCDAGAGFGPGTALAVQRCLDRGLVLSDIAIVCLRGRSTASLQTADRLNQWRLQRFTGQFDADGNAIWTDGDLRIDSVRRFKGQSAPAIVLTECDFAELTPLNRRLLFVGMTRARLHLEWVVSAQTAEVLMAAL
jgi:thymidine kinase